MERSVKNLQAPDCGHPDCALRNQHNLQLVGNLLKAEATEAQQIKAGELLHDAFVIVNNALPPELLEAIVQSHGQAIKAVRVSSQMGQALTGMAEGQVWPSKGSERPN